MPGDVFLTVGTTRFEALIKAADNEEVAEALVREGYKRLIMQIGTGTYKPRILVPSGASAQHGSGLVVEFFDFLPTLKEMMAGADLVISHAGSGSIFEALALKKPLIAVPNPILMHNHQAQLVEHLAGMGHCIPATVHTLPQVLSAMRLDKLRPYAPGNSAGILLRIDKVMEAR